MMLHGKLILSAVAVLTLISLPQVAAGEETSNKARLAEINAKVEADTKDLEETSKLEKELTQELKSLQDAVKKLRLQESELRTSLDEKMQSAEKLRGELETSQGRLAILKRASGQRLRTIYMHNHQSFLESVMLVSDQNNLRRHAYFLSRIREHDQKILNELIRLLLAKSKQAKELSKALADQGRLKIQILNQRTTLGKKLEQQEKVVRDLRNERTKLEESIASLKSQAAKLESVLVSLTSKEEPALVEPSHEEIAPTEPPKPTGGVFVGAGLMALRGKLPAPVKGGILPPAPKEKRSFKEMIAVKGVNYECPVGEEIRAIAPGRVIYVGRMPGLGNLAIVDHGQRYYSLYGGVSTISVSLGENLAQSGTVAKCSDDGSARLYFEIRKNGTPVVVKEYLRP